MDDQLFDDVLRATPPRFSEAEAAAMASEVFGVAGTARSAGSERDQTFLILDAAGQTAAVMKLSNAAESPDTLDMEALAAHHAVTVDPGLPIAIPWAVPGADPAEGPAAYRAEFEAEDGRHFLRMYDALPGQASVNAATFSDEAILAWGTTAARLGRALRGFHHPAADRVMLWDVQHASRLRALLDAVTDLSARRSVERTLERYEEKVTPLWQSLRAQVIHGDLTTDNALVDDEGFVSGIVDFGDMSHTALVTDIASVLESMTQDRDADEVLRVTRLVVDGYRRITPLEPQEVAILGELLAARASANVVVSSWRAARHQEEAEFTGRYIADALLLIDQILGIGFDAFARAVTGSWEQPATVDTEALLERRARVLGSALVAPTYDRPLHLVRGESVWLFDAEGRRYLDCYNNVPSVGHSHPRVTEAIAGQTRALNTNMRYLHETVVELAERLVASTPDELDTVMFVNSGSEANDLAWRLATTATGNRGGICTDFAYHGVTEAIAALSPENWPGRRKPEHIETFGPPDAFRGIDRDSSAFAAALKRLDAGGHGLAAVYLDGILTSDGVLDPDPELVREWVRLTQEAGGLWVADEVQGGHGRTGEALWSFERFGIVPDFVTLGKPMGNGHPVAAVITRSEIVDRFAASTDWFSTFGGNPVAAAAAVAVLDVIEDERVLERVSGAGKSLRATLRQVAADHPRIGDVRGIGLATAVELVTAEGSTEPDATLADRVANGMRERGVLVGTTGRAGNSLKIRPPLAFTQTEVPMLAEALDGALADVGA